VTLAPSAFPRPDLSMVNEEHVRRYKETDGEVGYMWNGAPILLLTTKGRKSGLPRTIAIIYADLATATPWSARTAARPRIRPGC